MRKFAVCSPIRGVMREPIAGRRKAAMVLYRTIETTVRACAMAFIAGFLASLLVLAPLNPARAQDLVVKYDQSQIVKLPRPVAEIIIGNPMIAEIAIHSSNTLVVTGKTFGVTNMIALDADRNKIEERIITVVRDESKVVNLVKGGKRESYNCSPQCNPSLVVGDDPQYFEMVSRLAEKKVKFSDGGNDHSQSGQ
jgi:hypothetical protein